MTSTRALVYVRLSSWMGENDPSTSPERQEEACRQYCAAKGWDVLEVVSDLDVSGSDKGLRLDRPGLKRIRAKWDEVDVVIFAKLDRLARNVMDFRSFAEEAERNGAALVSVAESLDLTTPVGKFVSTILAAFAEMEAATISDRIRAANPTLLRAGRLRGGKPPGWLKAIPNPNGPGKVAVLDEERVPIVREIVDRVLAREPYNRIARDLHDRGVPTFRGSGTWSATAVQHYVKNPALAGYAVLRGEIMSDPETGLPLRNLPPVVTPVEFARLLEEDARRSAYEQRRTWNPDSWLLDGIAYCGECGLRLNRASRLEKGRTYDFYKCRRPHSGCGVTASRSKVDAEVERLFLEGFGRFAMTVPVEVVGDPDEEARQEVEVAIDAVLASMRKPKPGTDFVGLTTQLVALQGRLAEITERRPVVRVDRVSTGETFAESWPNMTPRERSVIISEHFERVEITKAKRQTSIFDATRVRVIPREVFDADE
jgi:site-specific DNA recombinase